MAARARTIPSKPTHVSHGNVIDDLGFSPVEAAVLKLKSQLHMEIVKAIEHRKLTPKQLEEILNVPQPRISELLTGKLSKMSSDKLTEYLCLLGRSVEVRTNQRRLHGTEAA